MMLTILDMPKWKEKIIYIVLGWLGYKDEHFMLLDVEEDSVSQPERVAKIVWKDPYDAMTHESFEE